MDQGELEEEPASEKNGRNDGYLSVWGGPSPGREKVVRSRSMAAELGLDRGQKEGGA